MRQLLALGLLAALAACSSSSTAGSVAVGTAAPPWSDPVATGGNLNSASLQGAPVYLNFFATWCPPCNAEAPWLEAMQKRYAVRGLRIVGIDVEENAALARRFRAKYHLTYPIVADAGTLQNLYNVNGLPVHVFIGRDGVIRRIVIGEMAESEIKSAVKAILGN